MSEQPTIDEMLSWLDGVVTPEWTREADVSVEDEHYIKAIRVILEQHRDECQHLVAKLRLECFEAERHYIRAFVDRVEKRLPAYSSGKGADSWLKEYRRAVYSELEAMEKENARTND